ncbi:MAG: TetR/AcrR family transcriptional regulator [Proteobacteria bacterium]|nr:TetR/AcrR family transcriptional regulator [Pseudomonadota bacterium]
MNNATLKRPRTKPAEIRREELIDAAQALFLGKGFDDTSVDEIVKAADVAKGTFYFYFKTKDDVLQALRTRFVDGFHSRLDAAIKSRPVNDWLGRLDAWLEAGVSGYLEEVELHDLVFHEFRPSHRRMKHDNPIIAHLAALILGGTQAGAWQAKNPRLTAIMLFNALHGAVDDHIASPKKLSRKGLVAEVRAFCRLALGLSTV